MSEVYKPYAGIGARKTPNGAMHQLNLVGRALGKHGYTLRSGGATGADTAFEKGAFQNGKRLEIYLPFANFNSRRIGILVDDPVSLAEAERIAKFHCPHWAGCDDKTRLFHTRNTFQVLGRRCDEPSLFVACWTPDGSEGITRRATGGTGQAIRVAYAHGIPIFNFYNATAMDRLREFIGR